MARRLVSAGVALSLLIVTALIWVSPQVRRAAVRTIAGSPLNLDLNAKPEPRKRAPVPTASPRPTVDREAKLLARIRQLSRQVGMYRGKDRAHQALLAKTLQVSAAAHARVPVPHRRAHHHAVVRDGSTVIRPKPTKNRRPGPRVLHCWDFRWQQDAQRIYVADPSDPWGLDGAPGPRNGDGLACSAQPKDPRRPASTPYLPWLPPTPSMAALRHPTGPRYFGLFQPHSPQDDMLAMRATSRQVGAAPSEIMFFSGWDKRFDAKAVTTAWAYHMLPVVSWESRPSNMVKGPDSDNTNLPDWRLRTIISGRYDAYIRQWATDVKRLRLPIVLRLDHEMNGGWYPWSEKANGNSRGEYSAMWRHVHGIFDAVGADNVIWLWSPNVTQFPQAIPLADLYPGDRYVDWLGLVGYYRTVIPGKRASFDNTYRLSLQRLQAIDGDKPIVLSEVGCTENGGKKVEWMTSFFAGLAAHPEIVGFTWFNEDVISTPFGGTKKVDNNWRVDSSVAALETFRAGVRTMVGGRPLFRFGLNQAQHP